MHSTEEPAHSNAQPSVAMAPAPPVEVPMAAHMADTFFSKKEDVAHVQKVAEESIVQPADGHFEGLWILTEIDHWNNNHEKVVILTEKNLILVKYDFITKKIKFQDRVILKNIQKIQLGEIIFPPKSIMKPRNQVGIRIVFGSVESLGFMEKWNPMSTKIPYVTFTDHPLAKAAGDVDIPHYCMEKFATHLEKRLSSENSDVKVDRSLPIVVECYGNVASVIFNQSSLGFSKERNGVNF